MSERSSLTLDAALAHWLDSGEGELTIAQVHIRALPDQGFELRHTQDVNTAEADLELHTDWKAARDISWLSNEGEYRPLKGASNLRTGWRLLLPSISDLHLALDALYPAAIGLWTHHLQGQLRVLSLRATLERQTGMYRFARNISDAGAQSVIRDRCEASCLRHRLWTLDSTEGTEPDPDKAQIPFLCPEACNMLVADARKVSKAEVGK